MSSMLGRKILVITSMKSGNARSQMYRPVRHQKLFVQPTLTLGHIEDHHFVTLIKAGYLISLY